MGALALLHRLYRRFPLQRFAHINRHIHPHHRRRRRRCRLLVNLNLTLTSLSQTDLA